MAVIEANYAVMAQGGQGLISAWNRIESLLADLDTLCCSTRDMRADLLDSYLLLKARWAGSAQERQQVLRELARYVDDARTTYQQMDAALAAQFG